MPGMTLYEISDHLVALLDTLDMCVTDEERAQCKAEIDRYIEAELHKVDNVCRFLAHLESQAALADEEIKRLKQRGAVFANAQERLEQYIIRGMQMRNLRKMNGDTSTLTLRVNQPAVEIDDMQLLPAVYKTIKQEIVPDKKAIKSAIVGGESVAGAHLREPSVTLLRK